jgi:DNA-binding protein HU-beta
MNKTAQIEKISNKLNVSKKQADLILATVVETIREGLETEGKIRISDLGTFEVRDRAERKGRNPQTGEEIKIAASKTIAFKATKALKEAFK